MKNTFKTKAIILTILVIAGILRFVYATNLPLLGDETTSILLACGQATSYEKRLPTRIASLDRIKSFISYSPAYTLRDVFTSIKYADNHPPFYYLILRYVLRFLGNNALTLRLISIFLSLLSLLYIYRLGEAFSSREVGLYGALFYALSSYGVVYGSMVRPYPLAMFLSLLSTYQAFELNRQDNFSLKNIRWYWYALTVVIGFYTLYYFLFIFIFQLAYLLASNISNKKKIVTISIIASIVALLYLPWLPSFFEQYRYLTQRPLPTYIHGQINLRLLGKYLTRVLININFIKYLPWTPLEPVKVLLSALIYLTMLAGCFFLMREKKTRWVIVALGMYFLSSYAADTIFKTITLSVAKLYYLITPLMFILLATAFTHITSRYFLRLVTVLLCCALLLASSLNVCYTKPRLESLGYLEFYRYKTNKYLAKGEKGLVIINVRDRWFLFPFVHTLKQPVEMLIMPAFEINSTLPKIKNSLKEYDVVFLVNYYVSQLFLSTMHNKQQSVYSFSDISVISRALKPDFGLMESTHLGVWVSEGLMVFRKKSYLATMTFP